MKQIIVGIDEAGRGPLAGPVVAAALTVLNPEFKYPNLRQIQNYNFLDSKRISDFVFRPSLETGQCLDSNIRLRDSKLLSAKQRKLIYAELLKDSKVMWGIGQVSETQIDKINILQATRLAMKKAVVSLERKLQNKLQRPSQSSATALAPKVHDREKSGPVGIIDSLIIDGNILLDLPMRQKAVVKADATILQCMAASIVAKVTRDRLMLRLHKKYPLYGFDRHKGYGTTHHIAMLRVHGPCSIHRLSFAPCKVLDK
jgi:ribonuclease HII